MSRVELRVPAHGTTLSVFESGVGTPLLFLHGGLADHQAALLHVGALSERLRLITPDLRGAGRSHFAGELTWDLLADDVITVLDHLGLERAAVGGVSMGSAVALRAALRHPDRLSHLILLHPVYPGTEQGLADAPRLAMEALDAVGRRAPTEGVGVLLPLFAALPEAMRARATAMVERFDAASVAATTRLLGSSAQPFDRLDELRRVRCPTLLIPGVDPSHPAEVAHRLAAHIPGARLAETSELLAAVEGLLADATVAPTRAPREPT